MTDDLTHTITITIDGNYPHGSKQHAQVIMSGDGGLQHMIEAFKASLMAAGFGYETVRQFDEALDI